MPSSCTTWLPRGPWGDPSSWMRAHLAAPPSDAGSGLCQEGKEVRRSAGGREGGGGHSIQYIVTRALTSHITCSPGHQNLYFLYEQGASPLRRRRPFHRWLPPLPPWICLRRPDGGGAHALRAHAQQKCSITEAFSIHRSIVFWGESCREIFIHWAPSEKKARPAAPA